MRPVSRSSLRAATALAFLLALLPIAGASSSEAAGRGLAWLLRELICGCPTCEGQEPAPETGCCEQEVPVREQPAGTCDGGCTCSHPVDFDLPSHLPLSGPNQGGGSQHTGLELVAMQSALSAGTPAAVLRASDAGPLPGAPPGTSADPENEAPAPGFAAPDLRVRLATLCTALL